MTLTLLGDFGEFTTYVRLWVSQDRPAIVLMIPLAYTIVRRSAQIRSGASVP